MRQPDARQDRAEAIMEALAEVEERELADDASGVERRAKRIQAALGGGGEALADPEHQLP